MRYGAILADPPWKFATYNEKGRNRCPDWQPFKGSPSRHYETMATEDICALPVEDVAADDAVLFMWFSWPMLADAMAVIDAWGFTYKTCGFCWVKGEELPSMFPEVTGQDVVVSTEIGCGYWTRSNSEACLLATRGKPKRVNADVRQVVVEQRREHSRKPDCIYGRIERLVDGPYLEIFARSTRTGWDAWGNQVGKFGEVA